MPLDRISFVTDTNPESQNIRTTRGPLSQNVMYSKYNQEVVYATQRPSVNLTGFANNVESIRAPRGRGVHYWQAAATDTEAGKVYVVDDQIFFGSLSGTPLAFGVGGKDPVYFAETRGHLVITDPQNNKMYAVADGTTVLTDITTTVSNAVTGASYDFDLAGGVLGLNGYIFILIKQGIIFNSNLNDALNWNGNDFIPSARTADQGVYITQQRDSVVSISATSTEFFYDAGNPLGSPLNRRQDLFFNVGGSSSKAVFNTGEMIFFLGSETKGLAGVYSLGNFQLNKISNDDLDGVFAVAVEQGQSDVIFSAFQSADHRLLCTTVMTTKIAQFNNIKGTLAAGSNQVTGVSTDAIAWIQTGMPISHPDLPTATTITAKSTTSFTMSASAGTDPDNSIELAIDISVLDLDIWDPDITYVYDEVSSRWGVYKTTLNGNKQFPLVMMADKSSSIQQSPEFMFLSGDVGYLSFEDEALDFGTLFTYFDESEGDYPYIRNVNNYILNTAQDLSSGVDVVFDLPTYDGGTMSNKFCRWAKLVGTVSSTNEYDTDALDISYSDNNSRTYIAARALDTSFEKRLGRCGKFVRRNWRISYTGQQRLRVEGMEIMVDGGGYV